MIIMLKTPSLKGYWRFEGNANDASGNGNHGTIYGASSTTGKFGKALYFDGINDSVDISGVSGLVASGSYTVLMWANLDSLSSLKSLFHLGDPPSTNDIEIVLDSVRQKFGYGQYVLSWHIIYSQIVQTGVWYHLAVVLDTSLGMFLYVNGVLMDSDPNTARGAVVSTHTNIGTDFAGVFWYKGTIDEVLIYNRALSLPDIKRIMMGMHPLSG